MVAICSCAHNDLIYVFFSLVPDEYRALGICSQQPTGKKEREAGTVNSSMNWLCVRLVPLFAPKNASEGVRLLL